MKADQNDPIIIIEDDIDDQEIMSYVLKQLGIKREVMFFDNGQAAYDYLLSDSVTPFVIFSDINMPGMNGFQLRDKIHESDGLRMKCVPYVFLTTGGEAKFIWEAYSRAAQGYFIKPNSPKGWKELLSAVLSYWEFSKKPRE